VISVFKALQKHQLVTHENYNCNFVIFAYTRPPYWTELNLLMISVHFGRKPNRKRVCGSLNRTSQNHYVSEPNRTGTDQNHALEIEFGNACRFRVFHRYFSTVSRFSFTRFEWPPCWHGRTEQLKVARIFTKHWKCCDKYFVPTMSLYAFISLLCKQLLYSIHADEIFHCTIRFINPISIEVPYESFSISFHFN